MLRRLSLVVIALAIAAAPARAQTTSVWASTLLNDYRVTPNVTYLTANNFDAKLDIYTPRNIPGPHPTVMYIHGGGWVGGSKEGSILNILPYLELGFAVVNVQYRLGRVSLAPAAVEDCRCALRWVIQRAKEYNFDTTKIMVTGNSAGGHLALTTGMLTPAAGLERQCPGTEDLKVAAIVNWYGITDVVDLLDGPNQKTYAVSWLGSLPNREEVARRVSPLQYIRKDLPPILTIHGDADPTVPYAHATKLQGALEKAGVAAMLHTVPKGGHGGFPVAEQIKAFDTVRAFLAKYGMARRAVPATNP
jgi:acetyl esterase/lipase